MGTHLDSRDRDRDVASRDRDEAETFEILTKTRRWYVSRSSRDRDVETESTALPLLYNSMGQNIRSVESVRVSVRLCVCNFSHYRSRNYERILMKFGTGVDNRNEQGKFVSAENRKMVRGPFAHKTAQKRPEIWKSQSNLTS